MAQSVSAAQRARPAPRARLAPMDAARLAQVPQVLQVPQPAAPQRTSRAWQGDSYELQWMGAQRVRSSPSFPPPAPATPLPQAPGGAVNPVKDAAGQGGRDVAENHDDLFGGSGMYEDLRPLALGLAVCGLLPVAFRPERFSFHPGRSTLLYSLAVTLAICWSGWRLVTDRLELLETRQRVSLNTRFTSVVSFGSMTGLCMTPLLWFEARHVRRHQPAAAELMDSFGATFRRSPRRWARTLSWSAVVLLAVFVPACEAMWIYLLAAEGGHWTHIFAHNQVLVVPIIVSCLVAGSAYCVKRFADALRATLSKELRRPWLVAARVDAYRRAWLQLRDLTERLVRTPLTAIAMLLHMLLMSTLAVYQALVGLLEGEVTLGVLLLVLGTQYYLMLLLVCDAVHRAVEAVGKDFLYPLETFVGLCVPDAARVEVNLFREVVATSALRVTVGGYWDVTRATMTSVLSATLTYVIVLVQFREPAYSSASDYRNQSALQSGVRGE